MEDQTTPLFERSKSAVFFALNHTRSIYAQPLMTKAANALAAAESGAKSSRRRDELIGLDGAGQAGLIYIHLENLPPFQRLALVARVSKHSFPCACRSACCMGVRPNPEWVDAIKKLNDYVRNEMDRQQAKSRKKIIINPQLRRMLIEKHYGRKYPNADLSEQFQLSENTITTYSSKVREILNGWEKDGWTQMDRELSDINIIGATT